MDPEAKDFLLFAQRGSPEALARVFDALAPRLLLIAGHLTRDAARAEDLVQTTFLQAMRDAQRYDGTRPLGAWLAGILRHRAEDERRRAALRATEPLGQEALSDTPDPADAAADAELYERVVAAVLALDEPYRAVLALRIVHGLEPVAIAHALGRPPGTVRMQLKRGLAELRRTAPAQGAWAALAFGDGARGLELVRAAVLRELTLVQAAAVTGALVTPGATLGGMLGMKLVVGVCAAALAAVALVWAMRDAPRPASPELLAEASAAELDLAARAELAQPPASSVEAPARGADTAPAAPPAAAPEPTALAVHVTFAADGAPAAGAGVYVRPAAGGFGREEQADAGGRVLVAGLAPGLYEVHADRCTAPERVSWPEEREVELAIPAGFSVSGRVVDRNKAGVPGARVYRHNAAHHDRLQALAVADQDGRFELREVADELELLARAPGFQPSDLERVRARGPGPVELELRLGAVGHRLQGRVVGPAGEPAPFAWVALGVDEDARRDAAGSSRQPLEQRKPLDLEAILLRADGEGRFDTRELPGGHTLVLARAAGDEAALLGWRTLWVQGDVADELVVRLGHGAEIAGVVRDGDGRPVAAVSLQAEWEGTPELGQMEDDLGPWLSDRTAVAAEDGSFRMSGLLPGDYDLRVHGAWEELAREERMVEAGASLAWNPVVETPAALDVRLLGPQGEPLQGWAVVGGERPGQRGDPRSGLRTGADGRVRVLDLKAGKELALTVFAPAPDGKLGDLPVAVREGVRAPASADAPELEVRLTPGELPSASLGGRLLGADGAPLAGARLQLQRPGWGGGTLLVPSPDGAFLFERLAAGELRLEVRAPGLVYPLALGDFTLGPAEARDAGTLVLPAPARLRVSVLTPSGAADASAQLELVYPDGNRMASDPARWSRGAQGFSTSALPGEYVLRVNGGELAPWCETVRVAVPETSLTVHRVPGEAVAVQLGIPEGNEARAIVQVRLRIWDAGGSCLRDESSFNSFGGSAERVTRHLPIYLSPGTYRVRAQLVDAGERSVEAELTVPRPADAEPLLLDLR